MKGKHLILLSVVMCLEKKAQEIAKIEVKTGEDARTMYSFPNLRVAPHIPQAEKQTLLVNSTLTYFKSVNIYADFFIVAYEISGDRTDKLT